MIVVVEHGDAYKPLVKKAHERMVLCRECKYQFRTSKCPMIGVVYDLSDYDFCCYGERRDEDDKGRSNNKAKKYCVAIWE